MHSSIVHSSSAAFHELRGEDGCCAKTGEARHRATIYDAVWYGFIAIFLAGMLFHLKVPFYFIFFCQPLLDFDIHSVGHAYLYVFPFEELLLFIHAFEDFHI